VMYIFIVSFSNFRLMHLDECRLTQDGNLFHCELPELL